MLEKRPHLRVVRADEPLPEPAPSATPDTTSGMAYAAWLREAADIVEADCKNERTPAVRAVVVSSYGGYTRTSWFNCTEVEVRGLLAAGQHGVHN